MNDLNDLLAHVPVDQIADRLGVDVATADAAVRQALPALVGGMSANADDPSGAASLAGALEQHDPGLLDGGVELDQVDVADGEKIVGHVFGDNRDGVVQALGGQGSAAAGGIPASLIAKLLPLLAPIVMSYLAKRLGGSTGTTGPAASSGAVLADILASILRQTGSSSASSGSSSDSGTAPAGGFDLGSILGGLGGLLGGGRR
jgi:hypothetical protein